MERILVVDDEGDIRMMVKVMLEAHGWVVEEAASGAEALAAYREGRFRAMVLDQRMPNMSGFELARALRGADYAGRIVFFSAHVDEQLVARLIEEVNCDLAVVAKTDHKALVAALAAA